MTSAIKDYIDQVWQSSIVPTLTDYIRIPNKSPMFDPDWLKNGYMQQAVDLFCQWAHQHAPKNMQLSVLQEGERTPVILIEIPGQIDNAILLYGHLDKQPEMSGWHEGFGPWEPVLQDGKLYGRGGADDGYALFTALTAIKALQEQNIPHGRCVILIEASEESGSFDLPFYMEKLKTQIGQPDLVIALDSGCGNYEQLWVTSSLRGILVGDLTVEVFHEGIHSGFGGGIYPTAFQVARQLISRIEDENTGKIIPSEFYVDIPAERKQQAEYSAKILGTSILDAIPHLSDLAPLNSDLTDVILNRTWRPTITVTGADGFPPCKNAGNVLLPKITLRLSMRVPPTLNAHEAYQRLKQLLEENPPYHAKVSFEGDHGGQGWNAPATPEWLAQASDRASQKYFQKPAAYIGEGGSIPFMAMLGEFYPQAAFLITGVLGPHSNAHGPNEFLHVPFAQSLTAVVAEVISAHYQHYS